MKSIKFFYLMALFIFLSMSYTVYNYYNNTRTIHEKLTLERGRSLGDFQIAFRKTYQKLLAEKNITIDQNTISLLPVKSVNLMAKELSRMQKNKIIMRTVSDKPRNISNQANKLEKEMIEYFQTHPDKYDRAIQKDGHHYYFRSLRITDTCLKCHSERSKAPEYIRKHYDKAYGYKLGEVRGMISIKMQNDKNLKAVDSTIIYVATLSFMFYLLAMAVIYRLWSNAVSLEKKYTERLESDLAKNLSEINKQKEILYLQAHYDSLTGLPNRLLLTDRLEHAVGNARREDSQLAVLFVDIDRFKLINDTIGHHAGDELLVKVSQEIKGAIRQSDTLGRLSGDELIIIQENISEPKDAYDLALKIQELFKKPFDIVGQELFLSCSIGISIFPKDAQDSANIIKHADAAMYSAKQAGRGQIQFYSPDMTEAAYRRVLMSSEIRKALNENQFKAFFQPQIDIANCRMHGMEALVRWIHPEKGLLSTNHFLSIAKETGLIADIDRWMAENAMKQFVEWLAKGYDIGKLSLNLSMSNLRNKDFIETLDSIIRQTGLDPERLIMEVTESQVMEEPEESTEKLEKLREMGIAVAIDDFGTGHSSLSYLKKLPIDILKIDQSFVRGLPQQDSDKAIVKSIITLSESLKYELIAEGVETKEQLDFMRENGCYNIQGYYFDKPLTAEEMEEKWLKTDKIAEFS